MAETVEAPIAKAPKAPPKKKKSKIIAVVHEEGCTGCEVCIEVCPVDCMYKVPGPEFATAHANELVNAVVWVDTEICIGCKLCAKYCPWEVIDMVPRPEEVEVAS